ncbi:hypothetical protein [Methylocucumis oryzae]|uniref:Uncharacterized protein n=1 Tax=Methylocucumis oryzae TaxID=1632867 RepID=A0A0F3II44_9GAMM|nr:hypothetical protein [Methylocucumis oryzae]KJV06337.1 hypothetical protein VZ94_11905 [Methylocucumis oryzae]
MNKLVLFSAITLASVAAQSAFAHTGIRDVVTEGKVSYNAFNLSHGCNGNGDSASETSKNIIAISALFPNAADPTMAVVTKLNSSTGAVEGTLADLSNDIEGVTSGVGFVNLGLNTVQPNVFPNFVPRIDSKTLVGAHSTPLKRGFFAHNGKPYESAPIWQEVTSSGAFAPFSVGPISFKATSCATALKVRIAEVNYCNKGIRNYKDPARADVWIGHMTTKFNDSLVMPYSQADLDAGKAYWPTMTVNRDLTAKPLPESCGTGYTLAIEPADADIDANLPIPVGQMPDALPAYYWPTTKK